MEMLMALRKDLDSAAEMVNQIEFMRAQLYHLNATMGTDGSASKSAADELDKKLSDIEESLIQPRLTGQGQDTVRWPPKLLTKINYLANGLAGSDFGPTNQQREVQALLHGQFMTLRSRLDEVVKTDVANFNKLVREFGIQAISSGTP